MEMTTAKTVAVFAIIFGCFAVLYPKIFHPMVLHIMGIAPATKTGDDINARMPPHLRPGGGSTAKRSSGREEVHNHMRPNAHPGLRAAAEMKKAATAQQSTGGKGMMGVILPMYAVGIVIYLIYTLTKVFGKKNEGGNSDSSTSGKDYLNNHFSDLRSTGDKSKSVGNASSIERRTLQKQKELEKLLMKAESEEINDIEMNELKRRLLETEAQMSRILQAMEVVQQKVGTAADLTIGAEATGIVSDVGSLEEDLDGTNASTIPTVVDDVDDDDTEGLSADDDGEEINDGASSDLDAAAGDHDDDTYEHLPPGEDERNHCSLADELEQTARNVEDYLERDKLDDNIVGSGTFDVSGLRQRVLMMQNDE